MVHRADQDETRFFRCVLFWAWLIERETRSPGSALLPFFGEGSPTFKIDYRTKNKKHRVPTYSNLANLENLEN